jgi:catechol 2,3-dioxygenase
MTTTPYTTKLGHAHLKVRDLERAVAFYTSVFGLRVTEQVGEHFAFLTDGQLHHNIALQALGEAAPAPHPYGVGLYHIAFELADKSAFAHAYQHLRDLGVQAMPVDHVGISWAMYFNDPDGNGLELYVDTRHEALNLGGLWRGENRRLVAAEILAQRVALESEG